MKAIWVGVDDTDSPRGGCTTWMLTEIVRVARAEGIDLIGEPRLVRLNPNIPWKTRGNAALAARFGRGRGRSRPVGSLEGREVSSFTRGAELPAAAFDRFVTAAWSRILELAPPDPGTDPALVATRTRPPESLYWTAVREVARVTDTQRALAQEGAVVRTRGTRRGLIGAAAAIAWRARKTSWELITYRQPGREGTRRFVEVESVRQAQREEGDLALCYDARTRRMLIAPHTPCPILFGLRSRTPGGALRALPTVRSEPIDRWLLFRTNQGSGDHLVSRSAAELAQYRSAEIEGTVASAPCILPGGHAVFELADASADQVTCVAFEPTKVLPKVVQRLGPGDRVRVWGSVGRRQELRLEGLRVWGRSRAAAVRPRCPGCQRGSRSLGRGRGFRCPSCGRRWPPEAAHAVRPVDALRGEYHPTASARRHLARWAPEL